MFSLHKYNLDKGRPWSSPGPALLVFILVLLATTPAYGYVDPNAGSYISQLVTPIIMVVATGGAFFRKQLGCALRWLGNRFRRPSANARN
jgi:hypothetical protein